MRNLHPYLFSLFLGALLQACFSPGKQAGGPDPLAPVTHAILEDTASFYYVDSRSYDASDTALPIGIFDSGTGGLTVMDALVRFDENRNDSSTTEGDGIPDFSKEKFIYLADMANMPYGNYNRENKNDLLAEHVLKDVQFLLSDKYYPDASARFNRGKQPVKAIVIACNTATAYAKKQVEELIEKAGINVPVIGVIDAGARGALEVFRKDESGSIAVFATAGTIASQGYENSIKRLRDELGYTGDIRIYSQGGHGVAEAVDQEPAFISHRETSPRADYLGPSLKNPEYPIEKALLPVYHFDLSDNALLCDEKDIGECRVIQLNSPANYVRYHLVSLLEKIRKSKEVQPLKALILGCTHYPYLTRDIRQTLDELYNYKQDGQYVYRHLMQDKVHIIDPARNVAIELYAHLRAHHLFNTRGSLDSSEFYISIPNPDNKEIEVDETGKFTYRYKYGRTAGNIQEYVKATPFSRKNIPAETIERMNETIPETFRLIQAFSTANAKTASLPDGEKIK